MDTRALPHALCVYISGKLLVPMLQLLLVNFIAIFLIQGFIKSGRNSVAIDLKFVGVIEEW